jgi:hypothetical protein
MLLKRQLSAAVDRSQGHELRVSIQALLAIGAGELIDPFWLTQYESRSDRTGAVTVQKSALKRFLNTTKKPASKPASKSESLESLK